jgi:hypothetical protein
MSPIPTFAPHPSPEAGRSRRGHEEPLGQVPVAHGRVSAG